MNPDEARLAADLVGLLWMFGAPAEPDSPEIHSASVVRGDDSDSTEIPTSGGKL